MKWARSSGHRVGFAIRHNLARQLTELPQGKRLMTVQLKLDSNQMAIVVSAYAATLDSQDDVKEAFCASLDNILSGIPKQNKTKQNHPSGELQCQSWSGLQNVERHYWERGCSS